MSEIVGACLSQFHGEDDDFELLLAFSDGREIGHLVHRAAGKRIASEFSSTFDTDHKATAWRTMDSAPKDGTRFLAFELDEHFDCWWVEKYDEAYWMDWADSEPNPTHWMPLPTPPVQP